MSARLDGKVDPFPSRNFSGIILVMEVEGESGREAVTQFQRFQAGLRKHDIVNISACGSRETAGDLFCRLFPGEHSHSSGKLALDLVKTVDASGTAFSFRITIGKVVAVIVIVVSGPPGGDAVGSAVKIDLQTAVQKIETRFGALCTEAFRFRHKAIIDHLHTKI